jgi:hypothetical protein
LRLQRTAGNRATARLLQRFPDAADIDMFWSELADQVEAEGLDLEEVDCRAASNRMVGIGRAKAKRRKLKALREQLGGPLYRISSDDRAATPDEAKNALGRGWSVRDRVVSFGGREYLKVHSGGADDAAPTVRFYPLLPGMMIYSAESVGWQSKTKGTYRWYLRHAAIYRGGGWIRENFGAQRRNIMQGHKSEDRNLGAYGSDSDPKFLTTLAIYDPFYAFRSKEEAASLDRGPRTGLGARLERVGDWLFGEDDGAGSRARTVP